MVFLHTTISAMISVILYLLIAYPFLQGWNITQLSAHDGLSSTYITKIIQCTDGYLYFGTQLGVDRYDGRQVIHISMPETNPDLLSIRDLGEDCNERIWILSDAGICRLNAGEFYATQQHYFNGGVPIRMVKAKKGKYFYFVLKDSSLCRININTDEEEYLTSGVKFMCSDLEDRIIFTDYQGMLNISDISSSSIERIMIDNPSDLSSAGIACLEDGQPDWRRALRLRIAGDFLFADMDGMSVVINLSSNHATIKPFPRMYDVVSLQNGDLFVAANGISIIDRTLRDKYHYENDGESKLSDNFTNTTCIDREGGVWVGTRYQGIYHFSDNYSNISIVDFYQTLGLKGSYTTDFTSKSDGTIEISTRNAGIIQLSDGTMNLKDKSKGLMRKTTNVVLEDGTTYTLEKEILTSRKGNESRIINTPSDRNTYILDDKEKGYLWVASATAGLWKMKIQDETFEKIEIFKDIPGYSVNGIIFDSKGLLWGVTDRGVFSLNTENNSVRIFSELDGFPTNGYTGAISILNNNTIYIGMLNGFISFEPDMMSKNFPSNEILFVDFQRLGSNNADPFPKEPVLSKSLVLPYESNSFSLGVSDLSFAMPSTSALQYRILGFQDEWTDVEEGRIVIANLPSGRYRLEINQNPNFHTNASSTALDIKILPHPLLSVWAIMLYIVLVSGIVAFSVFLVRKKERERALIESEKKAAEDAREMYVSKVDFLYSIVQVVGTPLTFAKSILDSLHSRFANSTDLDLISELQSMSYSIDDISTLINNFAGISTSESTLSKNIAVKCNINEIVNSVFRKFSLAARKKGLIVSLELPDTRISSSINKALLEKILAQLISNAIKYSSHHFSIHLENDETEIRIIEENDGEIIPTDLREKIFDPFSQISSNSLQYNSDSGFGLYVCRSLTEELGGTLSMDNDLTINRFIITLPFKKVSDNTSYEKETAIDKPTMKPLLMLVDSNSNFTKYLSSQMHDSFSIQSFKNGKDAIEFLEDENNRIPNIVIANIFLPELNGFELCSRIKSNSISSHIPVILISSGDSDISHTLADKNGADILLSRPFTMERLSSNINNLLEGRKRLKEHYQRGIFNHPDKISSLNTSMLISELDKFLTANISAVSLGVDDMASAVNMSASNLQKKLKITVQMTPKEYLIDFRMNRAAALLENDNLSIRDICEATGYDSQTYFTKVFKRHYGVTPKDYRKRIVIK